jgi:hypothetical protein
MPRARRKSFNASNRRIARTVDLSSVPVMVPDSEKSSKAKPSLGDSQSAAQPDTMDDWIKRMIEAAYT